MSATFMTAVSSALLLGVFGGFLGMSGRVEPARDAQRGAILIALLALCLK